MTTDTAFVDMIGRNLAYFEHLRDAERTGAESGMRQQLDGLYRSISFGASHPDVNRRASELFVSCFSYIENHGSYKHWAKLAIRIANRYSDSDTFLLSRVVTLLGVLQQESGDIETAEKTFRSAERLSLAKENEKALLNAWYYLATFEARRSNLAGARSHLLNALRLIEDGIDDGSDQDIIRLHGFVLNLMAMCTAGEGHLEDAIAGYESAYAVLDLLEVGHFQFIPMTNIATIHYNRGNYDECKRLLLAAKDYTAKHQLTMRHAQVCLKYALLMDTLGEHACAIDVLDQISQVKLLKLGNLEHIASLKFLYGKQLVEHGAYEDAKQYFVEASALRKRLQLRDQQALTDGMLGITKLQLGEEASGITLLHGALDALSTVHETDQWKQSFILRFETALKEKGSARADLFA